MPIYEYYCPDNHTIYQFYAKTLAQGRTVPPCPDNPEYRLVKLVSSFAVGRGGRADESAEPAGDPSPEAAESGEDPRMDAALEAMEREFSAVDENDPRAMGRMMRRMAELTGEKIEGEMEEVVRKLEEGVDPDSLEEALGGEEGREDDPYGEPPREAGPEPKEARARFKPRRRAPTRDPRLHDYP